MTYRKHRSKDVAKWRFSGFSGRPNLLDPSHGQWRDESGFARNSKGWKPDIRTLQQGHTPPVPWGPLGSQPPPNVSQDPAGYNTALWPDEAAVAQGLMYLGYRGTNGRALLRGFQAEWNYVVQRVATDPAFQGVNWARVPAGNLVADGNIGPRTLNAMEIAAMNKDHGVPWRGLVEATKHPQQTQGRVHVYSAK